MTLSIIPQHAEFVKYSMDFRKKLQVRRTSASRSRCAVTTVKKIDPPGMHARRYRM